MAPYLPDLLAYVGSNDSATAAASQEAAVELVDAYLSGWFTESPQVVIPPSVLDRAYLEVAAELFHRKSTRNGVAQFATADTMAPIRINRDPLSPARPILAPYLLRGGFA